MESNSNSLNSEVIDSNLLSCFITMNDVVNGQYIKPEIYGEVVSHMTYDTKWSFHLDSSRRARTKGFTLSNLGSVSLRGM